MVVAVDPSTETVEIEIDGRHTVVHTMSEAGLIVATTRGHSGDPGTHKGKGPGFGLLVGPGQKRHHVDVPEEFDGVVDANELHRLLLSHLPKH